ncbi:hypothetical protein [Nocardiopsis sp. CNT312]|uniref:hypothetical protein n=1 Tax=Nocardiopsis sp. CNT312 TaxID=1137268 RepID=UPI001E2C781D|nr:hypothetical protein [Nocardiopsis sp. CNT312]
MAMTWLRPWLIRAIWVATPEGSCMKWTKAQLRKLCDQMREQGRTNDEIADEIRIRSRCSPLAAYRHMHGWSQAEATERYRDSAAGLPLDQAGLSRLELWPEVGGRAPQAAQVVALATLYGTSPRRLLTPEGFDKLSEHERNVLKRIGTQLESPGIPQKDLHQTHFPVNDGTRSLPPERQIDMAAKRAMRFGAMAEGTNVGVETIQELFDEVSRLASAYPCSPLHELLGDLVEAQDVAFMLLEGRQRPNQSKDLYLLSGLLSMMLAKASHDLGDPHAAMKQARTAFICADNADHDGLRIRVRTQQSLMAYWAGWPAEAARYAELARGLATERTGTAAIWLMSQSARTWASLGNGERALDDLQEATALRERLGTDDLDELGGLMRFAHCRQLYYGAETQIWIPGREEQAQEVAQEAVRLYEAAAAEGSDDWAYQDEAGARADLGYARASLGEIEGATEALSPVLDLPSSKRVAGVVNSVMRVHGALRSPNYTGSRTASRLRQEIEAYSRTPVSALTSGR